MKNSKRQPLKSRVARPVRTVTFSLHNGEARHVCLAGTFNDWNAEATPLHQNGNQAWVEHVELPPGTHEYQFVVDGRWMPDPQAAESVPNPFGGVNSVLRIAAEV